MKKILTILLVTFAVESLALPDINAPNFMRKRILQGVTSQISSSPYTTGSQANPNCAVYDDFMNSTCLQCKDQFLLPNCNECQLGQKAVNNQCQNCGQYQLFCDSSDSQDYCYKGFQKVGNQCTCGSDKQIFGNWCTIKTDLIYSAYYELEKGRIVCQFSSQISISNSTNSYYSYPTQTSTTTTQNCGFLTNYQTSFQQNPSVICELDSSSNDKVYISLNNTSFNLKLWDIIPQFDINQVKGIDSQGTFPLTSITYQPSQPASATIQQPYFNMNNFTAKLCYFNQSIYYFISGGYYYTLDNSLFIREENFFYQSGPNFSVVHSLSEGLTATDEQSTIEILGSYSYPLASASLPGSLFSVPNKSITLSYVCLYPFNLVSSNTVTFKSVTNLNNQCNATIISETNNFDEIKISISCFFNNFTANNDDIFNIDIQLMNLYTIVKEDNVQKKFIEFPYTYSIPPFLLDPTLNYTLNIIPKYLQTAGQQTQIPIPVKRKEIDVQIIVANTTNVDPRQAITLKGLIDDSAVQVQDKTLYQYQWSCYDEIAKMNCLDDQQNVIVLDQTQINTIKPNALEYNGVYNITLIGSYSDIDSKTVSIVINTIQGQVNPVTVVYDPSYDSNEIDPNNLLKFTLQYNDSDKLRASYLNHTFEFGYNGILPSQLAQNSQKENVIYTAIDLNIPQQFLSTKLMFYIRFFLIDSNYTIVGATRRKYFNTESPPYDCQLVVDTQLTGNEVAFVDKIKISANNCKSSQKDGILYYLFSYLNGEITEEQQQQLEDSINKNYDKYLNQFTVSNTIETYLPPGKTTFIVLVKDSNQVQAPRFSTTITMKDNTFDVKQYESFLAQQRLVAIEQENNSQYEQSFCTWALMLECIADYEKNNKQYQPSAFAISLKVEMRNKYVALSNKIPNDLNSHLLQEYIVRCLGIMYDTLHSPDEYNLLKRVYVIDGLVQETMSFLNSTTTIVPTIKSTQRKKLLVALDITVDNMQLLTGSSMSNPSLSWSDLQLSKLSTVLETLALTLYTDQQLINWDTPLVNVEVQKVDEFNLFKNYLDYDMQTYGNNVIENNQIYQVEIQTWKQNIYSFEQSFKNLTQSYLSKAKTPDMRDILMQTYPAVYPRVSKGMEDSSFRLLQQDSNLQLPSNINSQFNDLTGNDKVKCAQRIKDVWTKSSCVTKVTKQGDKFKVTCSCPTPNYTSLVADVDALFDNPNINHIFSESGINSIVSMHNWYKYATIYVIILINLAMIATFFIGIKLDKQSKECIRTNSMSTFNPQQTTASLSTALAISNQSRQINRARTTSIGTKLQDQNCKDYFQKLNALESKPYSVDKQDNQQNSAISQNKVKKLSSLIQDDQNIGSKTMRNQERQVTQGQDQKVGEDNTFKQAVERQSALDHPQRWCQTTPQIKIEGDNNSCLQTETETASAKEEKWPQTVCAQYRIGYVECKNRKQHTYKLDEDPLKKQETFVEYNESGNRKSDLPKQELKKQISVEKKRIKKEKNIEIQNKSYQYLLGLSIFKGICLFHHLLQIFIAYDKEQSRLYRFSIFYNEIIWLLALNAAFGEDITIVQVIALSIVSSICFGILRILLRFFMNKKKLEYIGYALIFAFLIFCYYAILVVMSGSQPSVSNHWITNFVIAQCFAIFISGVISSAIKYYCTLQLLPKYPITHFVYRLTSARVLFCMFKD